MNFLSRTFTQSVQKRNGVAAATLCSGQQNLERLVTPVFLSRFRQTALGLNFVH
jgi:hypothetical protein